MIPEITGRDARYRSPLPPETVVERLAGMLVPAQDLAFADDGADMVFAGVARGSTLHIACRHRRKHDDSEFGLHARIYRDGNGTQIRGRFRTPTSTSRYLLFWFASMVSFSVYMGWTSNVGPLLRTLLLLPPLVMIGIVVGLSFLHRSRLHRDETAISALLNDRVEARRYRLKTARERRARSAPAR
ncbi:hypothetical protein SAMN06295912_106122 [Sphingomonas laterariae]|uniref:Uncharacterized protein n=1 Tax=Edaphosphingomonas laterariae TaxID=861865 RepID=A0A239EG82_9SPHN|nr:hypothetical protein [Sphingomonas laterariae]SNS43559.1 hypothetical protein SAMN06295912_106122 [Sphingomonas laterariae]